VAGAARPGGARGAILRGRARLDDDPHLCAGRARPGDIAVVAADRLDRRAAVALRDAGVVAVLAVMPGSGAGSRHGARRRLPAPPSPGVIDGLLPPAGAALLTAAGVAVAHVGRRLDRALSDGEEITLGPAGGPSDGRGPWVVEVRRAATGEALADAVQRDPAAWGRLVDEHRRRIAHGGESAPLALLCDEAVAPPLRAPISGRPVLVAAPGPELDDELHALEGWIADRRPVVVAAGTAALTALERHHARAAVAVSPIGADLAESHPVGEVVAHSGADEALARAAGHPPKVVDVEGDGVDLAVWLALTHGASLVVVAGARGASVAAGGAGDPQLWRRLGGGRVCEATAVATLLAPSRFPGLVVLALVLAAVGTLAAVVAISEPLHDVLELLWLRLRSFLGA
jgi:uncharacterized membrane-anchored protein